PPHLSTLSLHDALPIYAGGEQADRRHLLRLHELPFEPLPVREIHADELDPRAGAVLHVAGVHEHGNRYAVAREEVQIVAARVAPDRKSTRLNSSHVKIS